MGERVIIITGASDGIGFEVAKKLSESPSNDVIMACRNDEKTRQAMEKIHATNPAAKLTYMHLDLSIMKSVRQFVDNFHSTSKPLHVLINNAGIFQHNSAVPTMTEDQFEITMATNHLGHFLLTHLLLDDLKKSAGSGSDVRIVVLASTLHDMEQCKRLGGAKPLDLDDIFLQKEGSCTGIQAYKNSKLANVMFTYHLDKQLSGTGVAVNCLCPGFIPTTELSRAAGAGTRFFMRYILGGVLRFARITRTLEEGGIAVCALAVDEKLKGVSGKFFRDGVEAKSSDESLNEETQKKLWELSARYTNCQAA